MTEYHYKMFSFVCMSPLLVIGVSYLFKRAPLDAFLEIAPIIFIAPPLGLSMDLCYGIRVYP